MHTDFLRKLAPALALVAVVMTACSGCGSESTSSGGPFPAGAGIQQGISLSSLTGTGWRVCYEDPYSTPDTPIQNVLDACAGKYMTLACRSSAGTDTLTLAAGDVRETVVQEDAAGATTHHVANGVGWYFTRTQSWGFFPAGLAVNRNGCDSETAASGDKRLCWNVIEGALQNGYRCGANDLNLDGNWRRLVLVHD
jgi:hypothetical protein